MKWTTFSRLFICFLFPAYFFSATASAAASIEGQDKNKEVVSAALISDNFLDFFGSQNSLTSPQTGCEAEPAKPNPIILAMGGDNSGGGGGSGVACFANENDAELARAARASGQPFPRHLLSKIVDLETTDHWELRGNEFIEPEPNETSVTYLERFIKDYLDSASPLFAKKLRNALVRLKLDKGLATDLTGHLKPIADTGSVLGLDQKNGHCALVQIAVRRARTDKNGKIEAVVGIDQDLFNLLGMKNSSISRKDQVINQAMLRLHEAIYLLGYGLGHKTSEQSRLLTGVFFSKQLYSVISEFPTWKKLPEKAKLAGATVFLLNQLGFGDFVVVEAQNISPTKKELLAAAYQFNNGMLNVSKHSGPDNVAAYFRLYANFNDSESFMAVAHAAYAESIKDHIHNLLDPEQDSTSKIKEICAFTRNYLATFKDSSPKEYAEAALKYPGFPSPEESRRAFPGIFERAEKYCRKLAQ